MPLPSVALVALIRRDDAAPAAPSAPRINRFGGLNGESRVLFWEPAPYDGIQLFDVLWSAEESGPWQVINPAGLLSSVYLDTNAAAGFYRIRARDLFGRVSVESAPLAAS